MSTLCVLCMLSDFCLEGTCELCLVEGKGLQETSWKADPTGKRSCIQLQ